MTKCINHNSLAAKFLATYGTVYYVVVATLVYTIGLNVIFYNYITLGVTKCRSLVCNVAIATYRTSVGGVTTVFTIGGGYYCIVVMTKRLNHNSLAAKLLTTKCTVNNLHITAIVYTIGSKFIFNLCLTLTCVNSEAEGGSALTDRLTLFVVSNEYDRSDVTTCLGGKCAGEIYSAGSGKTGVNNS